MIEKSPGTPARRLVETGEARAECAFHLPGDRRLLRPAIGAGVIEDSGKRGRWVGNLFAKLDHRRPANHRVARRTVPFVQFGKADKCRNIALIAFERLYLKVDDTTRAQWEAAGCEPFVYEGKGKPVRMSYYTPPHEAMEAPDLMLPWARMALGAALRARAQSARPARVRAPASASSARPRQPQARRTR